MIQCIFTLLFIIIHLYSNSIGIITVSLLFAFLPAGSAHAYFPEDFKFLSEGNPQSIRRSPSILRDSRSSIPTGFRSQRGRKKPQSLRIYSTDSYVSAQQKRHKASRNTWRESRANQIMDICREKFPDSSLRCFSRNHRLTQMQDIPVTLSSVR